MAALPIPSHLLQEALDTYTRHGGNNIQAAQSISMDASTFRHRVRVAVRRGMKPTVSAPDPLLTMKFRIAELEANIASAKREELTDKLVREQIFKLGAVNAATPDWVLNTKITSSKPGVPTLFFSDWHWGEVVDPAQVNGVNEFNLEIAHKRARQLVETAVDLLKHHMVNPNYPGIVLLLGGDMFSGDVHEELSQTNSGPIMPMFVDLFGVLTWAIKTLADEFGRVFVVSVCGNHPRLSQKPRMKHRTYTNFDWLLSTMLESSFKQSRDTRVQFLTPSSSDAFYNVCGHRYYLCHGDDFRGGESIIGAIGPLTRGLKRKLSRSTAIDLPFDTMVCGHWHQWIPLPRLIVNGSLKGYDEYANRNSFEFEPPTQGLWLTHPERGITFTMPIYCDRARKKASHQWVEWKK
jgi:hypothetical protein